MISHNADGSWDIHLEAHEHERLCAALRRDMHREADAALTDAEWSSWHRSNSRYDIGLLQAINPKAPHIILSDEELARRIAEEQARHLRAMQAPVRGNRWNDPPTSKVKAA